MWTTPTSTGAPNYAPAKGCTSRQPEPDLPDPRPARCCTNATLTGLAATGRGVHAWVSRGLPRPAGAHQPGHTSQVTPAGSLRDHGEHELPRRTDVPRGVDRAVLDPVGAVAGLTLLEWRQGQPASPQVPVDEVVDVRARGGEQERLVRVCRPAVEVVPAVTDRKSTRLNSSHVAISYAAFCLKKKKASITRSQSALPVHECTRGLGLP